MGGEPVIIFPSAPMLNNFVHTAQTTFDDVSDLGSYTEDHMAQHRHDRDDNSDDDEEEDFFPDFPPNFDFQSKSIPPHFLCPLTKSIMICPVIDSEGNTYERRAVLRWLDLEDVSPVTGNPLSPVDLVENKRRMAAIEKYREEVWNAYNADEKDESLYKRDKRIDYEEKQRRMKQEKKKFKKGGNLSSKKHDMLTDKSVKLLLQMQDELDVLQLQQQGESDMSKHRPDDLNSQKKDEFHLDQSHVEYLLHKRKEDKSKNAENERVGSRRQDDPVDANKEGLNTSLVMRKHSSRSPHEENKSSRKYPSPGIDSPERTEEDLKTSSIVMKHSSRSSHKENKSSLRKSLSTGIDSSETNMRAAAHRNSPESSLSSLTRKTDSKSPHFERKNSRQHIKDPDVELSIKSLELAQSLSSSLMTNPIPERKNSRRLVQDPTLSSSMKSTSSHGSKKVSPAPPPPKSEGSPQRTSKSPSSSNVSSRTASFRNTANMHDRTLEDMNKCSITDMIIAEVNGCPDPTKLTRTPSASKNPFMGNPTTASTSSESQHSDLKRDHGWSVPIGVHKIICDSPGLLVTCDVHRMSAPVKRVTGTANDGNGRSRRKHLLPDQQLIIPPGAYIEVVETQVHGDRVRGRIVWDESIVMAVDETTKVTKRSSFKLGKLTHKKDKVAKNPDPASKTVTHRYTGWVSLRWSVDKNESKSSSDGHGIRSPKLADESAGPWTEPVSLGVYCISFSHGLPVRASPDRNSALVGMLEKGQYVEVVETHVKGDRVRARCILAPSSRGEKSLIGWISLFNAMTGSSGATAVPCGAYVAVSDSNSSVTEGGSLNSKFRSMLQRGSCVEIVATRIEDGVVRGLISTGGYVTLIGQKQSKHSHIKKNDKSSSPSNDEQYLMHVPTGIYKVICPKGLPVYMEAGANSPSAMDLGVDSFVQVVETRVQNGRVYGRIISIINDNLRQELHGWIYLFESNRRWCKFAFV